MAEHEVHQTTSRSVDVIAVDIATRLGLIALFAYWSIVVVLPFLNLVVWAVILAVSLYPVHQWLTAHLGGRAKLASAVITVLGLTVVLGPAAALSLSLVESVQALIVGLRDGTLSVPAPSESVRTWPLIGENVYDFWALAATNLQSVLSAHRPFLVSTGGTLLGTIASVAGGVFTIAASVLIAGFLYGHGPALAEGARRLAKRVVADRGEAFINLTGATIRNVSRGVVGVSVLQALLAGIGLLFAGIPGAGLITVGVLILSIIQIGPGLLLIPVTIWVWVAMDAVPALVFTLYILPIMLIDNVLKPIVMSRGLRTPMLVILIGLVGGTLTHGLIGLFLGPIVLAVFYELLTAWVMMDDATVPTTVGAPLERQFTESVAGDAGHHGDRPSPSP